MPKKSSSKDKTKKAEVVLPAVIESPSRELTKAEKKMHHDLEVVDQILHHPATSSRSATVPSGTDPLSQYVKEISRYKLLTIEEEENLIKELEATGDIEVAKKLVLANLRLVVKIALEYRSAWQNVMDLIQEGNIGLMKAVSKYDATKGAKLSYYASWWIRSYILKFILDNFRLVKIGTTNEQKKLFFNLLKEKERLIGMGINPDNKLIGENLGVSEKSVAIMDKRLGAGSGELSIEARLDDDGPSLGDILTNQDEIPVDERLSDLQGVEILKDHLKSFLEGLKERDREIFEKRLLTEVPASLQSIADQYGVSRERIRQIEERLINNLKVYMSEFIR
jgi:RNA polymerase sigma-32 factor